jgi:acetolactate synthase I/II/III large subunit
VIIGEQVARILRDLGIRRVYGLPGEDHMALLDALAAVGLEYQAAFNETSAVIMAATEAQLTGLPGVAVLSLAPGVSNGMNGLLNTFLDEVPLLLFSGQHPAGKLPFVVRQGFDIVKLVGPTTKWCARITSDMDIPAVIGKAIEEAVGDPPGPVYLELPDGVAASEARAGAVAAELAVSLLRSRLASKAATGLSPLAADRLGGYLATAKRPVLVLGGRRQRVMTATVEAFASAFRVPVFTTSRQKGVLDSRSAWFAGTFLNGRLEKRLLDQADLVLMIDPESFDFYNKAWCFGAEAVAITDLTFSEWMNPFADRLTADPEAALTAAGGAAGGQGGGGSQWSAADVAAYRMSVRDSLLSPGADSFSVARAVSAALASWPTDGYLVADAGFSKPLIAMLSDPALPDHFLASNALSTMGYSIPAALAARNVVQRPILAFLGDGSLLMRATELLASADSGAPLVFVALMDGALTQIEVKQERRQLARVGVRLPAFSCSALAGALGIDGLDVAGEDELRAAVAKGFLSDRPLLIGAHVDPAPSRVLFDLLRG